MRSGGRRTLVEGRERRISELVGLFDGLTADELATLASAAAIVEDAIVRPPSA